jgi:hypothetical protein
VNECCIRPRAVIDFDESMKIKILVGFLGILVAQAAFATSRCPAEVKAEECGPNPFYILVLGFSEVCSGKFPEESSRYRAVLERMVAENPKAYAEVNTDAEFKRKLEQLKEEANRLSMAELEHECRTVLLQGREPEKS